MTNLQKLNRNANRLQVLTNRFLKVLELNKKYGYDLSDEFYMYSKNKQYARVCEAIKTEKQLITIQNRRLTQGDGKITLTKTDLYNLTAPVL